LAGWTILRIATILSLVLVLLLPSPCHAGSFSLPSTVGTVVSANYGGLMGRHWLYRIRYDKEANDEIPGAVFDLQDVQDGIFRLPAVSIRRVAYYYSQFFVQATKDDFDDVVDDDAWEDHSRLSTGEQGQITKQLPGMHSGFPLQPHHHHYQQERDNDHRATLDADWTLFAHVYIVMETEDGNFHSIEKFEDYIDFRTSKDPSSVLNYQWGETGRMERSNSQFAQRVGWRTPFATSLLSHSNSTHHHHHRRPQEASHDDNTHHGKLFLSEIVPFLEQELQNPYHVTNDNCKHFVKRFQRYFMNNPCHTKYPTHQTCGF